MDRFLACDYQQESIFNMSKVPSVDVSNLSGEGWRPFPAGSPPILLCNAAFYGTLAAVRSLGRAGVSVVTADPAWIAPASCSRHATRHLRCPPFENTDALAEWLLSLGRSSPRQVIYATSDDVSFALATHRDALTESFLLYQPDLDTMMRILDKGALLEHARAVGIDVPETWLPRCRADVERIGREGGTLLVKPRTQVSLKRHAKGAVSRPGTEALCVEYERFLSRSVYGSEIALRFPEATQPLIQRYLPEGVQAIYSLSGFRDKSGKHFAVLAANKVLQRPRRLGIGLCFESAPVDADLAERVRRLCERIGYYGAFELEFIGCGDRLLLIDMNARFYNQVAFDVARGLRIPELAYAGAIGEEGVIARLISEVPGSASADTTAFCNRFGFEVMIRAQRLVGKMSREDAARWREWCVLGDRRLVDAVADRDDPGPFACEVLQQIYHYFRHPLSLPKEIGLAG